MNLRWRPCVTLVMSTVCGVDVWGGVEPVVVTTDPDYVTFVRHHQDQLRRTAFLLCGDRHLAEDLLQEALVKLAMSWESVHHPSAYVRRIIYRDGVSMWRRRRREVTVDALPEVGGGSADRADTQILVREVLQTLPRRQRATLVLRYFEDLTEAQTAEIMGISVGTVKSLAHQAKRRLREALGEDEPEEQQGEESAGATAGLNGRPRRAGRRRPRRGEKEGAGS